MSEEAQEYKLTLSELTSNNKTQINLLTILADDYKNAATHIVDTIESHLHTVTPQQKLLILYVCDSILKNVKGDVYKTIFSKKIIPMFLHVFQHGDEKIRAALYKLRVTWSVSEVFVPSKMYQLDMKVNGLDGAWPIANPKTGRALKDDPAVKAPKLGSADQAQSKIFLNRKFIQDPKMAAAPKVQQPIAQQPKKSATSSANVQKKDNRAMDPLDKLLPPAAAAPSTSTSTASSAPKRKAPPPAATSSSSSSSSSTSAANNNGPKRRTIESPKDLDMRPKQHQPQQPVIRPTSVAGSHAFSQAPKMLPPPFVVKPPGLMAEAPPVAVPPAVKPVIAQISPDSPPPSSSGKPQQKAIITNEAVKLDIPQNNRIFVDGKAYEVMFIDDVAVIERAGAPHRIYFAGPPRNVLVDGIPYMLKFGETRNVEIGGGFHTIRFGAPSRELYMGGYPFKGQFGGPPIVATINGTRHEIRLTGSAPEVKIEPDPAYDLARFLSKMREQKKVEIKQEQPKEVYDPFNMLKRLKNSGLLPPLMMSSTPQQQSPAVQTSHHHHQNRQNQASSKMSVSSSAPALNSPIMAGIGIERRPQAASLKEFNLRLLKVRYDDVIATLMKKRDDCCKYCGMRMDSMPVNSKEWTDHMDWHVKRNLSKQETNQYRKWYPTSVVWLTPKANEQVDPKKKNESEEEKPAEIVGVISSGPKECAICQEKFDEVYDHEEEAWRLKDSVYVNDKVVHVACSSDASALETPTMDTMTSPFFIKSEPMDEMMMTSSAGRRIKEEVEMGGYDQQQYQHHRVKQELNPTDSASPLEILNRLIGR